MPKWTIERVWWTFRAVTWRGDDLIGGQLEIGNGLSQPLLDDLGRERAGPPA